MNADHAYFLALWGTVLSTALAAIKIWEVARDRLKLTASYSIAGDPKVGNEIIIYNTSKTPALITYWELMWADRRLGWTLSERMETYPNEGYTNITVQAHSKHVLYFKDKDHFDTRSKLPGRRVSLYIRIYLPGRRSPMWLFVRKADKLSVKSQSA